MQQSTPSRPAEYGSVKLDRFFDTNFIEYTSYVIRERAIPDLADGLKPVQRRIMQTLFNVNDGRFHKVANVVGETMKLHPHGDASIFTALVNLANKEFLIERQGNFGNLYTGDQASAARYIECRLTPLALETLFNKHLTEFVDSYDGRTKEPVVLPSKLPLLLLLGTEGIAVGMSTRVLPHNFRELLEAQKKILSDEPFEIFPDFQKGGILDVSEYDQGMGKIRCRARIEAKNEKTIVIKEIPHTTTTQSLLENIEKAVRNNRLKIQSVHDYTAEEVEIEIKLPRGVYAEETIKALYAFTDCEVSITSNPTVIRDNMPVVMSVHDMLRENTRSLVAILEQELTFELGKLKEKRHERTLEQIFIEERIYKRIEEEKSYTSVVQVVATAMAPYADRLEREITREDVERLLEIRIRRISRYDINRQKKELQEITQAIHTTEKNLKNLVSYAVSFLDDILNRYGRLCPRRSCITSFEEVTAKEVALSNLRVSYDRDSGMLGTEVHGNVDVTLSCSEYDKIILFFENGMYRVVSAMEKTFVGPGLVWAGVAQKKLLFNVVYQDGASGLSLVKRFHMPKFILEKEYRYFPEDQKSQLQYFSVGPEKVLKINLVRTKRAKTNQMVLQLDEVLVKNVQAVGKRVATREVRKVVELQPQKEAVDGENTVGAGEESEEPSRQMSLF